MARVARVAPRERLAFGPQSADHLLVQILALLPLREAAQVVGVLRAQGLPRHAQAGVEAVVAAVAIGEALAGERIEGGAVGEGNRP